MQLSQYSQVNIIIYLYLEAYCLILSRLIFTTNRSISFSAQWLLGSNNWKFKLTAIISNMAIQREI